jgi:hypothetical protein
MTSLGATLYHGNNNNNNNNNMDTQYSSLLANGNCNADGNANTPTKSQAAAAVGPHYTLYSMHFWDVRMPPVKKHMVHGYLVPTMRGAISVSRVFSKRRRISVEVYRPTSETTHTSNDAASIVQTQLFHQLFKGISTHDIMIAQEQRLQNDDISVLRVLQPKPHTQANDHNNNGGGDNDQDKNMLEHEGDWGACHVKIRKDLLYER